MKFADNGTRKNHHSGNHPDPERKTQYVLSYLKTRYKSTDN